MCSEVSLHCEFACARIGKRISGFRSRSVIYRSLVRSCVILHARCRGCVVWIVLVNSELPGAGRHSDVSMGPPNLPSPPGLVCSTLNVTQLESFVSSDAPKDSQVFVDRAS
jgi:hypothetical protein